MHHLAVETTHTPYTLQDMTLINSTGEQLPAKPTCAVVLLFLALLHSAHAAGAAPMDLQDAPKETMIDNMNGESTTGCQHLDKCAGCTNSTAKTNSTTSRLLWCQHGPSAVSSHH